MNTPVQTLGHVDLKLKFMLALVLTAGTSLRVPAHEDQMEFLGKR